MWKPENLSAIAKVASDYEDVPLVAYMSDLSWWQEEDQTDLYLDAHNKLLPPNQSVGWKPQNLVLWALP